MPFALTLRDRIDSEVRTQAAGESAVVAAAAGDLLRPPADPNLAGLARTAAVAVRGRVIVVDARGRLIVDSAGRASPRASFADRPEVAAALRGRRAQVRRHSASLAIDLLATAAPIRRAGRVVGAVRVTQSVAAVATATRRVVAELALVGAAVLALALFAGGLLAAYVARPLRRLEAAARTVAAGDLRTRAREEGSAEQRSLAHSFNDMTAQVDRLLRSQERFVADASHQLRTPLTALRLRLEEAREAPTRPALTHELDAATVEVDRLAQTVDELLVLSGARGGDRPAHVIDLSAAAGAAAQRFAPMAAARATQLVVSVKDDAGPGVRCAPDDLDRALDALVENALNYGGSPGVVEIVVDAGRIQVRDRGRGPLAGEEEAVFERFRRGSAARNGPPGTGLGLPIVRELARGWGGEATLATRPGGGAIATLTFPAPYAARAEEARSEAVAT